MKQAGIDKEFLIECAADYVRTRPNLLKPVAKNAFSDKELRELKAAGMLGQADVAKRLGVSSSRISDADSCPL